MTTRRRRNLITHLGFWTTVSSSGVSVAPSLFDTRIIPEGTPDTRVIPGGDVRVTVQ